jgi:nucleotide-binding universal stress UspA family protein
MSGGSGFGRILVAYDGTPGARRALERAADLALALSAEIGVVSVTQERLGERVDDPWGITSAHASQLHEAVAWLGERGLKPMTHEPTGDAGPMIVRTAEDLGYDTIVVGSRGLGPVRRAILGSVSQYVATHAAANVIIAR